MNKLTSLLTAVLLLPASVMASTITDTQTITVNGPGSVGYTYFSLDATGSTSLETFTDNFDPELFLFRNDGLLGADDLIATNDDGGTPSAFGFSNSFIAMILNAGNYIAAVGNFNLTTSEAVTGINNARRGAGSYDLLITSTANISSVPEPANIALLGLSLLGFGVFRRRTAK